MAAQQLWSTTSIAQEHSGCSDQLDVQPEAAKTPRCSALPQELTFFSRSLCFSIASSKLKPTHSASSSGITNSCDKRRSRWYISRRLRCKSNSHNDAIQRECYYRQTLKHYCLISGNESPLPFYPFPLARVLLALISRVRCRTCPLCSSGAVSQHNSTDCGCWWCFYAGNHHQLHKTKLHTGSLDSSLQHQYEFSLLLASASSYQCLLQTLTDLVHSKNTGFYLHKGSV